MTDAKILAALDQRSTLGLTLWAEARGQGLDGLAAVGRVIRHRAEDPRWPSTYKEVCLQPKQFSCWNPGPDANHARLMALAEAVVTGVATDPALAECLFIADGIRSGQLLDRTKGANHYWSPDAMVPAGRVPAWAKGKRPITIGGHKFLKL